MLTLSFPKAGRWLVAAALAAPLAAAAQTVPAANTSTTISTNTSATLPGTALPGAVLSGTTQAVGGATRAVSGAARNGAAHVAEAYHAAAPEQRAARMSQQIGKELNLDAATTAKVQAAALVRAQKIDAIQTGTTTNKEKNTALQANAQEFKAALQGILTPAQYTQYLSKMGKAKVSAQVNGSAASE